MKRDRIDGLPAEVEGVRVRLEKWRAQRRAGQRIPEDVWADAARVARRHGLSHVCQALGLDYKGLKRRTQLSEQPSCSTVEGEGVFVELAAAAEHVGLRCVVELEKGNGAKLRVSVGDASAVDWCRVKEAFLGA